MFVTFLCLVSHFVSLISELKGELSAVSFKNTFYTVFRFKGTEINNKNIKVPP